MEIGGGRVVQVSVRMNFGALARDVSKFADKEMNLIARNSLLDTGFITQKHLRTQTYGKAFHPRQSAFKNVITSLGSGRPAVALSRGALKTAVGRNLEIVIFDKSNKEYMQRHATGGIKRPEGNHLAIPGRSTVEPKRTGRGIPKRLRPSTLLDKPKAFIAIINGQTVIARRRRKTKYPIEVMHILEPTATIRKSFNFYEDSARLFRSIFPQKYSDNFNARMRRAFKTKY